MNRQLSNRQSRAIVGGILLLSALVAFTVGPTLWRWVLPPPALEIDEVTHSKQVITVVLRLNNSTFSQFRYQGFNPNAPSCFAEYYEDFIPGKPGEGGSWKKLQASQPIAEKQFDCTLKSDHAVAFDYKFYPPFPTGPVRIGMLLYTWDSSFKPLSETPSFPIYSETIQLPAPSGESPAGVPPVQETPLK